MQVEKSPGRVAVKLYTGSNGRQLLANERDIYCLTGMNESFFPVLYGVVEDLTINRGTYSTSVST